MMLCKIGKVFNSANVALIIHVHSITAMLIQYVLILPIIYNLISSMDTTSVISRDIDKIDSTRTNIH